jgi:hypothetical protein
MANQCLSASTQPSIIDCCDSTFKVNGSIDEQQINLLLRSLEEKFDRSQQEMKSKYDAKCEQYEEAIAEISKQLIETKRILIKQNSKLHTVVHGAMMDQNVSMSSSSTNGNDDLPYTLNFDKDSLRKNQNSDTGSNICSVVVHQSDRSQDHLSSYEDTTATPASIEGLIRKELRSYLKEVFAERETQTYLLQRDIDKQNRQIEQLRIEVLSRLRALDFHPRPREMDHPVPLHCMKFEGTEVEIELIEESKMTRSETKSSPKMEHQLALVHTEDPLIQFTSQVCNTLIMHEAEHLMKTWGTQFDDLTIYLQDNLDKQRECIADVQKSTFEHVDAETQTRIGVLNAQLNYLGRQTQQQDASIQELREEQERSFIVIVETLIKLKSKFEGIDDRMKKQEEMHSLSEIDITKLHQKLIDESNLWTSRFKHQEGKIQQLKGNVDHSLKEIEGVIEDRDSIQTILSATIELFNEKMESSNSLMGNQIFALENRLNKQIEAGQSEIQKMNTHKRDMDIVITAICKKLVDLSSDIRGKIRTEIDQLLSKSVPEENPGKHDENSMDHFKYIKVNQKKYKKALWLARNQYTGSKLLEHGTTQKEIEFYDLTFTESKSSE